MITVDISDLAGPAVGRMRQAMDQSRIAAPIGAAVKKLFQMHLLGNPSNRQGWPSTGFWAGAARSTSYAVVRDGALVSVAKQGVRQRYVGGEIHPVKASYLTLPARAEAYGKRAGEFDNLVVAWRREGGKSVPWALVEAPSQSVAFGRRRKDNSRKVTEGSEVGGAVYFWLVKSVTQKGDRSVLPSDEEITNTAMMQVEDLMTRAINEQSAENTKLTQ